MKTDLTRLPPRALPPIARVIATGDAKYTEGDWLERDSRDDIRAALGHLFEFIGGRDIDDESGEHVLAHAAARLLFVLERQARGMCVGDWRAVEKVQADPEMRWSRCPNCWFDNPISPSVVRSFFSCSGCRRRLLFTAPACGIPTTELAK